VLSRGREIRDILVIHPIESLWGNKEILKPGKNLKILTPFEKEFVCLRNLLLESHIDFDYGDEDIIGRHGSIVFRDGEPRFKVAEAEYKAVVIPSSMTTIRGGTISLLKKFREETGCVVFANEPPKHLDGIPSEEPANLAKECLMAKNNSSRIIEFLGSLCRRVSIADKESGEIPGILYQLREDEDRFIIFICNTGYEKLRLSYDGGRVCERDAEYPYLKVVFHEKTDGVPQIWDLNTGRRYTADCERKNEIWTVSSKLFKLGSQLLVFPKKDTGEKLPLFPAWKLKDSIVIEQNEWAFELNEPNVFVLDMPSWRIAGGSWNERKEILQIDREVRSSFGLPLRGDEMIQPWAREKRQESSSIPVELEYRFNVKVIPDEDLFLAIEKPSRFDIFINDRLLDKHEDSGWWVDKSLRKLKIPRNLLRE
jgi:hypothetical protein